MEYFAPHNPKTDAEILAVPAEHFPRDLSDVEQERWLRLVPEDRLPIAWSAAAGLGHDRAAARVTAEIDRRVSEKSLMAVRASIPPPPEPKKRYYQKWEFWVAIGSLAVGLLSWLSS